MVFNTKPVPKPRMTRSDKWRKRDCVMNYRSFCDEIRFQARDYELPDEFRVVFGVPFSKTFPKSKRVELVGSPHQIRPDVDNYLKALMDALEKDDARVWHVDARKVWTSGPGFILVEEFDEGS